jgi:hypothetical protein
MGNIIFEHQCESNTSKGKQCTKKVPPFGGKYCKIHIGLKENKDNACIVM